MREAWRGVVTMSDHAHPDPQSFRRELTSRVTAAVNGSRLRKARCAVAAVLCLAACSCAPAYQIELSGTAWDVTAIRGNAVTTPSRPRIEFTGVESAVVTTPCRTFDVFYSIDTDGDEITFAPVAEDPNSCGDPLSAAQDAAITGALDDATAWTVTSQSEIVVRDSAYAPLLHLVR